MRKSVYVVAFLAVVLGLVSVYEFTHRSITSSFELEYVELSHFDLLDASDVINTAKQSVINKDMSALDTKMKEVVNVAKEMPLKPESIDFLKSEQAKNYVVFQANRSIFDDLFEQYFKQLKDIDVLKKRYPEAKDKFVYADQIIAQRDAMLKQITTTLVNSGIDAETSKKRAAEMWKEKFSQ